MIHVFACMNQCTNTAESKAGDYSYILGQKREERNLVITGEVILVKGKMSNRSETGKCNCQGNHTNSIIRCINLHLIASEQRMYSVSTDTIARL